MKKLYFLILILLYNGCTTSTPIPSDIALSQHYHLRRIDINMNTSNYINSKIRPIFKTSKLFDAHLGDASSVDIKITKKNINIDTSGLVYNGNISILYDFIDVKSKKIISKVLVNSISNAATADGSKRKKILKRNLVIDNIKLLITKLQSNGISYGKYITYQGDQRGYLAMIAMSPLYAITEVGIGAIKGVKILKSASKEIGTVALSNAVQDASTEISQTMTKVHNDTMNAYGEDISRQANNGVPSTYVHTNNVSTMQVSEDTETDEVADENETKEVASSSVSDTLSKKENRSKSDINNNSSSKKSSQPQSRYGICFDFCLTKSGKHYKEDEKAGACHVGCSSCHWTGFKKAQAKCDNKYDHGSGLWKACMDGVDKY